MTGKWSSCCWKSGCGTPESTVSISTRGRLSEWEFKLSKCRKRLRIIWGLWCGLALNIKSVRHAKKPKNTQQAFQKKRRPGLHTTRPGNKTQRKSGTKNKHVLLAPLAKGSSRSCRRRLWKGTPEPHQCQPVINSVIEIAYTYPLREVSMQTWDLEKARVRKPACLTPYLLNLSDHCTFFMARYDICKYVKEQTFDPFVI